MPARVDRPRRQRQARPRPGSGARRRVGRDVGRVALVRVVGRAEQQAVLERHGERHPAVAQHRRDRRLPAVVGRQHQVRSARQLHGGAGVRPLQSGGRGRSTARSAFTTTRARISSASAGRGDRPRRRPSRGRRAVCRPTTSTWFSTSAPASAAPSSTASVSRASCVRWSWYSTAPWTRSAARPGTSARASSVDSRRGAAVAEARQGAVQRRAGQQRRRAVRRLGRERRRGTAAAARRCGATTVAFARRSACASRTSRTSRIAR